MPSRPTFKSGNPKLASRLKKGAGKESYSSHRPGYSRRKWVCTECGAFYSTPAGKQVHSHKSFKIRWFKD